MFTDSTGTFDLNYRFCTDMGQLSPNVTRNVNNTTITSLVNDGFITIADTSVLGKPAPIGSTRFVGDMTFAEFLEAYASL